MASSSTLKLTFLTSITSHLSSSSNHSQTPPPSNLHITTPSKLRAAVIGGGPAGACEADALSYGGVETFLFERNVTGSKPCGGAIRIFSPVSLVDRQVTRTRIFSSSNLSVDFGNKTLFANHQFIAMTRREVLDSFLRAKAQSNGAHLVSGLVTRLELPGHLDTGGPYVVHYSVGGCKKSVAVDVVIGADGVHSRVAILANSIGAGNYECALAFQERIKLPEEMEYYKDLAEMYVGDDVSPDQVPQMRPRGGGDQHDQIQVGY